ncbi:hypothetical protein [uncultured Jatrophihabitans sp.]|uniref:hypothetical protein n=1 Tax=uncultured Jatrophihabitans sp. TaxID=1610747 RepID=UPI0035CB5E6C
MSRTRRRPGPTAFRAAPTAAAAARPTRRQAIALLAVLAVVTGTVVAVSYLVSPDRARSFDLYSGSVFLADSVAPVAVDLASGRPTVRLIDADAQVGARTSADLGVAPLDQGTLLYNRTSGEFNMVASTGFVVKTNGGVPIAQRPGATGATAIASGDLAYLEQTGPTGTSVYLVGQTTVETAGNVGARVRPRAFRSMSEPGSTAAGASASAGGSLWLLLGSGERRTVRQLSVPAGSSAGAKLASKDHGRVDGPAALASAAATSSPSPMATVKAAGAAGDGRLGVVGMASADRIQVFRGSAQIGTARFPAVAGLDRVLPASAGQGRLSFLFHGSDGWSVASLGADGHGLRGPSRLTGLAATASLTAPATSRGSLYTMDTTTGRLLRIDGDNRVGVISGAATYPLAEQDGRVVEPGGFSDGSVLARGARVIFNSPSHLNAKVVFTDGSHRPLTIEKSSAVAVSAAGGAEALTRSRAEAAAPRTTPTPATQPRANSPVNNRINCSTVRQKPHIPTIVGATPGSRSVALSWTYPLLSPQDCAPSTYQVRIKLLSADAPSPPSTVQVQGQQSVNLAGLFPSTRYEIAVGAFINGEGTFSPAQRITTGPQGPAAPTDVTAAADSAGNWNVTFSSCGSTHSGCVAAASWKVIPEFCDGRGLSDAPAPVVVTADPTSVQQPPAQLRGGSALLGRGLRFQVEGTGTQGTVGEPSAYTACTYSWAPPAAGALSLHASTEPLDNLGSTTSATVTLDAGSNPTTALGGVGAQVTYALLSGGSVVKTIGPTTASTVTFTGINAGQKYQARASVAPPRHPDAAVTVGPIDVQAAIAPWPTISTQVDSPDDTGVSSADVTVHIGGLSSNAARGERFSLVNSTFRCGDGNAGFDLTKPDIDPADPITFSIDRTKYYGSCSVTVQLAQSSNLTDPPLFGDGTRSNAASTTFTVDAPTLPGLGSDGGFSAQWTGDGSSSAVSITAGNPLVAQFGRDFDVSVTDPDGTTCGGYTGKDSLPAVTIDQSCVTTNNNGASGSGWQVTVSHFTYFGAGQGPYTVNGVTGGAAPSYTPPRCDPGSAGITASWSGSAAAPTVTFSVADASAIKDCKGWTETVSSPTTTDCGDGSDSPATGPPVAVTCGDTPTADGWTVTVSYQDLDGTTKTLDAVPVGGTPPD